MSAQSIPSRIPANTGDLGTLALSPLSHLVLGCRMTFEGRLDPDVLARAVRLMLDAEPVLGCRLEERLLGGEWARCPELDAAVPFAVVLTGDTDRNCAAFHAEPFEDTAPRLAVRLLRSPYGDDLCVKVDHLVADGRGAKEVTYLLADIYTRLLADPSYLPRPNLTPRPTVEDLWSALTAEQRDAARTAPRMAMPRWRMGLARGRGSGFEVGTLTIFPAGLRALKDYGQSREATVNDMLVTALLRSLVRRFPPAEGTPLATTITADLRRFAEDERFQRACNLSSPQTIEIGHEEDETFDDTLRRVTEAVREWKDSVCGVSALRDPKLPHPVMRAIVSLFGSYAGRHGMVPPTVSTCRDTLTVWMGFHEEHLDPRLAEHALRGMDEELRAVAWKGEPALHRERSAQSMEARSRVRAGGWATVHPRHR